MSCFCLIPAHPKGVPHVKYAYLSNEAILCLCFITVTGIFYASLIVSMFSRLSGNGGPSLKRCGEITSEGNGLKE